MEPVEKISMDEVRFCLEGNLAAMQLALEGADQQPVGQEYLRHYASLMENIYLPALNLVFTSLSNLMKRVEATV